MNMNMLTSLALIVLGVTGDPAMAATVSFERLVNAGNDGNWLTYSGSYRSERFLALDEIKAKLKTKIERYLICFI